MLHKKGTSLPVLAGRSCHPPWLLLCAWSVVQVCEVIWWCPVQGTHPEKEAPLWPCSSTGLLTISMLPTPTPSMHPCGSLGLPLPRSGSRALQVGTLHTPVLTLPSGSPVIFKAASSCLATVNRSGWDNWRVSCNHTFPDEVWIPALGKGHPSKFDLAWGPHFRGTFRVFFEPL